MYAHIARVNIANRKPDALTKAQAHAVAGKEENLVAQLVGCCKQLSRLLDG
jgi:hypothetical protein